MLANGLFTYHAFRLNSAFRAYHGSKTIQSIANSKKIEWVCSPDFESEILDACHQASADLNKEWRWKKGEDLHDLAVLMLEKKLKLPELQQTVRRARLEYFYYP